MRTAESYIGNWKEIEGADGKSHRMILVEHAIVAINEARVEAIKECAEEAEVEKPRIRSEEMVLDNVSLQDYIYFDVDKQSILKLINQVK